MTTLLALSLSHEGCCSWKQVVNDKTSSRDEINGVLGGWDLPEGICETRPLANTLDGRNNWLRSMSHTTHTHRLSSTTAPNPDRKFDFGLVQVIRLFFYLFPTYHRYGERRWRLSTSRRYPTFISMGNMLWGSPIACRGRRAMTRKSSCAWRHTWCIDKIEEGSMFVFRPNLH